MSINTEMTALADAVRAKSGTEGKLTIAAMTAAVNGIVINSGSDIDLSGVTVTADKMLSGIVAVGASGEKVVGDIQTVTASSDGEKVTVPAGYIAAEQSFPITVTDGGGFDTSIVTATADTMLSGVVAVGKNGETITGNIATVTPSVSANVFTVRKGYVAQDAELTVPEAATLSVSGNTVTVPVGYVKTARTATIPEASVTETTTSVTIGVGYIGEELTYNLGSGGSDIDFTGVNVTADKMLEGIVAVDGTGSKVTGNIKTVEASKTDNVITVPVGYIAEEQTFEVGEGGVDTDLSFVTATAGDILVGKVGADVNGNPVHGTIANATLQVSENVVTMPKGYSEGETVTIPEMTIKVTADKITVPVGYNKMQREFELTGGGGETVEYGYIDEIGDFQKLDLSGETPVNSGDPVDVSDAGFYDIPAGEADYTTAWEPIDREEELAKYLTLTANKPNSTVAWERYPGPGVGSSTGLMYRTDIKSDFVELPLGETIELANAGDYVQFWRKYDELSSAEDNYRHFVITGDVSASGNIQSLLNFSEDAPQYCYFRLFADCTGLTTVQELSAKKLNYECYAEMFDGCTSLTTAPKLPSVELAQQCYRGMFYRCTSLTTAPELPASTLESGCYGGMFANCTSLTTAPELTAAHLAKGAYSHMFSGCTSLTTAPELGNIFTADSVYYGMFEGCTSLSNISVRFTEWEDDYTTASWVNGVSSTGTFYKPSALPEEFGADRIPTGWTVVNID